MNGVTGRANMIRPHIRYLNIDILMALHQSECFSQAIRLLGGMKRTATVRCIPPYEDERER